jgi:RNA-directed DNA polymerase
VTGHVAGLALAKLGMNGPEGERFDWDAVVWRAEEKNVRRLRQRIFKASQAGDLKQVRNLQKLMLRSRSNTLVSVRQVTQRNAGRDTAGVDGQVTLTGEARARLVEGVHDLSRPWRALPVKRVYIPKANGRQRPLGIPVILDRVHQARVKNALEPEWEARFEPRSYGFRPGRGCQDAIVAIHTTCSGGRNRVWVLDADLSAAFDRIDHSRLLEALGSFPARGRIGEWLKAGVVDQGRFAPTEEGTPQGGVISPLLLNIALHGLEGAAGVGYQTSATNAGRLKPGSPAVVRYADDLVALCFTRKQAEQVKTRLAAWLAPRGLTFNKDKTRIVHLTQGFDFLGFNVRRYPNGKTLIKPSKKAVKRIRERLRTEFRVLRGSNATAVLVTIAPIVRGWAAYYRSQASSQTFGTLDNYLWQLTYKWATYTHMNKPKCWVVAKYFGRFNPARNDRWVFGDRDSGAYLHRFSWTNIVRHRMVAGTASPDDPALADYWQARRRRQPPPLTDTDLRLLKEQDGVCPLCGDLLLHADHQPQNPREWEQWLTATRQAIKRHRIVYRAAHGGPDDGRFRLVHQHCYRRYRADPGRPAQLHASTPSRLA